MCFPHKQWVREWQRYHNKTHNNVKCKEKYHVDKIEIPLSYITLSDRDGYQVASADNNPITFTVSGSCQIFLYKVIVTEIVPYQ